MRPALGRPDAVDEGHLEEVVRRRRRHRNLPPLVGRLVDHSVRPKRLCIIHQTPTLYDRAVVGHLHLLADRHRQIPDATLNQTHHRLGDRILEPEPRKVRSPLNRYRRLRLACLDHRRRHLGHVVCEGLAIDLTAAHDLHIHLTREDVDQFDTVSVLTAHQFLFVLVVVCRGQKFTEDELRNVHVVLRVLGDCDRLAIVLHAKRRRSARDLNVLNRSLRLALLQSDDVIVRIHKQLVHQFVEPRIHRDASGREGLALTKIDIFICSLNAPNVGVGETENVLTVRLLTVCVGEIHVG